MSLYDIRTSVDDKMTILEECSKILSSVDSNIKDIIFTLLNQQNSPRSLRRQIQAFLLERELRNLEYQNYMAAKEYGSELCANEMWMEEEELREQIKLLREIDFLDWI